MEGLRYRRQVGCQSAHVRFEQRVYLSAPMDFQKKIVNFCCCFDAVESHVELYGCEGAVGIFQVVAFVDHLLHEVFILCVGVYLMLWWGWPFMRAS